MAARNNPVPCRAHLYAGQHVHVWRLPPLPDVPSPTKTGMAVKAAVSPRTCGMEPRQAPMFQSSRRQLQQLRRGGDLNWWWMGREFGGFSFQHGAIHARYGGCMHIEETII